MAVKFTIEAAQAARDAILADIEATQPRVLPGIDAQALALGLGQLVNGLSDRQRGRLAAFDGQEGYRALMIDELGKAAQTLWLTVTERNAAKDGSVPVVDLKTLAEEGRALRRTLTETLEYNLRGNAAAAKELAAGAIHD